jgi:hypothetical protein
LLPVSSASSSKKKLKDAADEHVRATASQIVEVMTFLENPMWLVQLLREMLHGKGRGEEASAQVKQRRAASLQQCDRLVDAIVELLVATEEENEKIVHALAGRRSLKDHIVAIISTLAVFSEAHPPLLVPHLHSLLPYLKGDAGLSLQQEEAVCFKVTDILSACVLIEGVSIGTRSSELAQDLTAMALKFGNTSIDAAIGCLSQLTQHHSKDPTALLSLADKMFTVISQTARQLAQNRQAPLSNQQAARMQRSLAVLGKVRCYFLSLVYRIYIYFFIFSPHYNIHIFH